MAWYIVPYKRRLNPRHVMRYCAMDDFTKQIHSSGGDWSEIEVEGGAIVKVKASDQMLATLDSAFVRLPDDFPINAAAKAQYLKPGRKPRYDKATDTIILDGPTQPLDIEAINRIHKSVK